MARKVTIGGSKCKPRGSCCIATSLPWDWLDDMEGCLQSQHYLLSSREGNILQRRGSDGLEANINELYGQATLVMGLSSGGMMLFVHKSRCAFIS